jgi:hypothetical protein
MSLMAGNVLKQHWTATLDFRIKGVLGKVYKILITGSLFLDPTNRRKAGGKGKLEASELR